MPFTLVPIFDFLNHSNAPSALHRFNADSGMFEVVAIRPIAEGEQVSTSYSMLSNDKLLYKYGFTIPDNPYNTVALRPQYPSTPEDDPLK
eukprot:gene20091-24051_t